LAQVYGIIKQHDGYIDLATEVGQGTTFSVYLPAFSPHQPETPAVSPEHLIQGQGQTILVVEDNNETRKALADSLELLNYRVLEATNGREALEIVERHVEKIALILSDMVMPEMGGRALLHALMEHVPSMRVILLTGHPLDEKDFGDLRAQGLKSWALKPLSAEQLAKIVAEALQ
jgi:CheY-like chemotaxis protein